MLTVSLNYHTNGAMMDLNDGMFLQNGCCGYVLKPAAMRDEISSIKADSRGFIPGIPAQVLYIRVSFFVLYLANLLSASSEWDVKALFNRSTIYIAPLPEGAPWRCRLGCEHDT